MTEQKNVSLVFPSSRNFQGFGKLGKNPESCVIPHGLSSIAACLEQRGHTVRFLALRDVNGWHEAAEWIKQDPALIYGISIATLDYHEAVETAKLIKRIKPNAKIVAGGVHPTILPQETSMEPVFDCVLVGEGEITFPELVENPKDWPKIVYGVHPNLDDLPYEKREIFNLKKVFAAKHPIFEQTIINAICGRGCTHGCRFCAPREQLVFGKFRLRSLDHYFGEIKLLNKKYNFKTLLITDDSFTLKPDYTLAFCDRYEKIKKPFFCQSRADFICNNEDVIHRLREVGLNTV
jgi:radical SAM superfamily enzyme YgiQ (UPF0313 family)